MEAQENAQIKVTENFGTVILKVRKIAKLFRKSLTKNDILQAHCITTYGHQLTLKLDCKTRWNSMAKMLAHFLKMKAAIKMTLTDLSKEELFPSDLEKQIIEDLNETLETIEAANTLGERVLALPKQTRPANFSSSAWARMLRTDLWQRSSTMPWKPDFLSNETRNFLPLLATWMIEMTNRSWQLIQCCLIHLRTLYERLFQSKENNDYITQEDAEEPKSRVTKKSKHDELMQLLSGKNATETETKAFGRTGSLRMMLKKRRWHCLKPPRTAQKCSQI